MRGLFDKLTGYHEDMSEAKWLQVGACHRREGRGQVARTPPSIPLPIMRLEGMR